MSEPRPIGLLGAIRYPMRGARFVYIEHRELARYWIPPILLTICLLVAVGTLVLSVRGELVESFWAVPQGEGFFQSAGRVLHGLVQWLLAALLFVVGAVLVALGASVLAAPFNDALSESVEAIVSGREPPPFSPTKMLRDLGRTVGLAGLRLLMFLVVMGPLFFVSLLVPVVGPLIYSVAGFCFTSTYLALDYVDSAAARAELSVGERYNLVPRHLGTMLGFGMGVWVLMFVPLLNLLFMPAAVAGGTLLFLDLDRGTDKSSPV